MVNHNVSLSYGNIFVIFLTTEQANLRLYRVLSGSRISQIGSENPMVHDVCVCVVHVFFLPAEWGDFKTCFGDRNPY